ncbi:tail fiber assembly protein [Escherichia coli]|uniref:tail fiber assembly protein n=1 Tax=Escherichia coli TaxID=562 RepID=UPI00128C7144|nr:tail fiber assembly protein [Escherichia coli]MPU94455.1 tail fiber assembly protein [Escherichia coli]
MNYWFSPANNAFYPVALKESYVNAGSLPNDLIEVEDTIFNEFSATPPDGKMRGVGYSGLPIWVDIPVVEESSEQIKARARVLRDEFIVSTDRMLVSDFTINNIPLTAEQQAELLDVRQKFKVWPESEGWPKVELPEIPQWILIEAVNNGYIVKNWPE